MLRIALTLLAVLTVGGCTDVVAQNPTPQRLSDTKPSLSPQSARAMINAHRARNGLGPLAIDSRLMAAARAHSADMARHSRMSHRGSDGSLPRQRAIRAGYNPRISSENVAAGYSSLKDVMRAWRTSRGHNANLLRRGATQMGIAMVYNPKARLQTYWTLLVGAPR